jgi:hypothetical protein
MVSSPSWTSFLPLLNGFCNKPDTVKGENEKGDFNVRTVEEIMEKEKSTRKIGTTFW